MEIVQKCEQSLEQNAELSWHTYAHPVLCIVCFVDFDFDSTLNNNNQRFFLCYEAKELSVFFAILTFSTLNFHPFFCLISSELFFL